jgi:hypothetical protein
MACCAKTSARAGNVCRSPVAIRLVTNIVLLISDTDFIFSLLFAHQLFKQGGLFNFFLAVMAAGVVTYFAGVLVFGPKMKFRTVKILKTMMSKNPDEFFSDADGPRTQVSLTTPILPPGRGTSRASNGTFADLECDEQGYKKFRQGMSAWNLIHLWNYAERQVALNSCETKHGVPFLRLARFGFYAAPTPKDLGGILNTNALYTFSTGIFQVSTGAVLVFSVGNTDMLVMLPLGISMFSLVLSVLNVLMDFSGILSEIESEKRLAEEIKAKNENTRVADRKKYDDQLEAEKKRIDAKYAGRVDVAAGADKQKELKTATAVYSHGIKAVEDFAMDILNIEIHAYRTRLEQTKLAMTGVTTITEKRRGALEDFHQAVLPYQELKDKINVNIQAKIRQVDVDSMPADDFERAVEDIKADGDKKIKTLDEQINQIKLDMMSGP